MKLGHFAFAFLVGGLFTVRAALARRPVARVPAATAPRCQSVRSLLAGIEQSMGRDEAAAFVRDTESTKYEELVECVREGKRLEKADLEFALATAATAAEALKAELKRTQEDRDRLAGLAKQWDNFLTNLKDNQKRDIALGYVNKTLEPRITALGEDLRALQEQIGEHAKFIESIKASGASN